MLSFKCFKLLTSGLSSLIRNICVRNFVAASKLVVEIMLYPKTNPCPVFIY